MSTYMVDTLHIYIIIYTLRNKKLKISHTFEKNLSLVFFDPKNFEVYTKFGLPVDHISFIISFYWDSKKLLCCIFFNFFPFVFEVKIQFFQKQ